MYNIYITFLIVFIKEVCPTGLLRIQRDSLNFFFLFFYRVKYTPRYIPLRLRPEQCFAIFSSHSINMRKRKFFFFYRILSVKNISDHSRVYAIFPQSFTNLF